MTERKQEDRATVLSLKDAREKREREAVKSKDLAVKKVDSANESHVNFGYELGRETKIALKETDQFGKDVSQIVEAFLCQLTDTSTIVQYIKSELLQSIPVLLDNFQEPENIKDPEHKFRVQLPISHQDKPFLERLESYSKNRHIAQKIGQLLLDWMDVEFSPSGEIKNDFEYDIFPAFVKIIVFPERDFFVVDFEIHVNLALDVLSSESESE